MAAEFNRPPATTNGPPARETAAAAAAAAGSIVVDPVARARTMVDVGVATRCASHNSIVLSFRRA